MKNHYEILVGNIGRVYESHNGAEALVEYGRWKACAQSAHHRASGEEVCLWKNGEPHLTHETTQELK